MEVGVCGMSLISSKRKAEKGGNYLDLIKSTRRQVENKPNLTSPDLKRCRLILVLLKYPARCLSVRLLYAASNLKEKNETIKAL